MSGGGGSGSTTTVQKSDPWSGQQPYLQDVFAQAQSLDHSYNPQYYPNSTVAQFTPTQQTGLNMETALGEGGGAQSTGAADQALSKTLNGDFLNASSNPYFQNMAQSVLAQTVPGLESQFTQGGAMNSPGAAYAVSQGANAAIGNLAYQNYNDAQTNMMRAAALAPGVQNSEYQNVQAVQDAGNQQQALNQANINDAVNRFNFQQQLPYNKLSMYDQLINGSYGGTSTMTQPYYQNKTGSSIAGGVGGLATGAMLGSAFGPVGTGVGAVAGGLLGLFGS